MIEHPIPQNVTSYQFHLVGDMTLKQFLELAAGIVLAWVIWQVGLPTFLKVPLAALSALLGFGLAFLPVDDRPLDQWLFSFFKSIYGPTILFWKKSPGEDFLLFKPKASEKKEALESAMKSPAAGFQTLLQAYQSQITDSDQADPLEEPWQARRTSFPGLFSTVAVSKKLQTETTFPKKLTASPERPETTISLRPLNPPENPIAVLRGEITLPPRQVKIPPQVPVTMEPSGAPNTPSSAATIAPATPIVVQTAQSFPTTPSTATPTAASPSPTTISVPPLGTYPNMFSGSVFGKDGHVLENAIIELRDSNNLPVRALKTNQLGQFMVATPLASGVYELEIEKEGESFDILRIEANGSVMAPIEIRAKERNEQTNKNTNAQIN